MRDKRFSFPSKYHPPLSRRLRQLSARNTKTMYLCCYLMLVSINLSTIQHIDRGRKHIMHLDSLSHAFEAIGVIVHERIRSIFLLALTGFVLFGVLGTKVLSEAGVEFPTWTNVGCDLSLLEGRKYQSPPRPKVATIREGKFQKTLEKYLSDHVPMRNDVLLANAKAQRTVIELANSLFHFDTYHTFYGSGYCYQPKNNAVMETPLTRNKYNIEVLKEAAEEYLALMDSHKGINWKFALVERPSTFAGSGPALLMNNTADYEWIRNHFLTIIARACEVIDLSYDTQSDFYNNYYLTDHHWNATGALAAYQRIAKSLNLPTDGSCELSEVVKPYWGSAARAGLCVEGTGDTFLDYKIDLPNLAVRVDGKKVPPTWLGGYNAHENSPYQKNSKFENVYRDYYHRDKGLIAISNRNQTNGSLLVVCDSFSNCIDSLFASAYKKVFIVDLRHYKAGTVDDLLSQHAIDDAVILMSSVNAFNKNSIAKLR